jgi:hypothetical protein
LVRGQAASHHRQLGVLGLVGAGCQPQAVVLGASALGDHLAQIAEDFDYWHPFELDWPQKLKIKIS